MKQNGWENIKVVIDIFVIIQIVLDPFKVCPLVSGNPSWKTFCSFSQLFGFINGCLGYQMKAAVVSFHLIPHTSIYETKWLRKWAKCFPWWVLTDKGQTLKGSRAISIITKMSMTISKFSQQFGFINGCVGYQIEAYDVLYKIWKTNVCR